MASIDIFNVQPHQVSRDMRGYSVFLYGGWKTGKTTTAVKFPKHFLLAFEKGYSAIPGAMAQPINSWSEFRQVLRQLKDEKAKKMFETIILDTADNKSLSDDIANCHTGVKRSNGVLEDHLDLIDKIVL